MITSEIENIKKLIRKGLGTKVDEILLIGSCARNEKNPSDIDLVIKFQPSQDFEKIKNTVENTLANHLVFVGPEETRYHAPTFPSPPPKPKNVLPIHITLSPSDQYSGSKIEIMSKNDAIIIYSKVA